MTLGKILAIKYRGLESSKLLSPNLKYLNWNGLGNKRHWLDFCKAGQTYMTWEISITKSIWTLTPKF